MSTILKMFPDAGVVADEFRGLLVNESPLLQRLPRQPATLGEYRLTPAYGPAAADRPLQWVENFLLPLGPGGWPFGGAEMSDADLARSVEFCRAAERALLYGEGGPGSYEGKAPSRTRGLRELIGFYRGGWNIARYDGDPPSLKLLLIIAAQRALCGGGSADVFLVSGDLVPELSDPAQAFEVAELLAWTPAGVRLFGYEFALGGSRRVCVPHPGLRRGTVVAVTTSDLEIRHLRPETVYRLSDGRRNLVADIALHAEGPGRHAWVEHGGKEPLKAGPSPGR